MSRGLCAPTWADVPGRRPAGHRDPRPVVTGGTAGPGRRGVDGAAIVRAGQTLLLPHEAGDLVLDGDVEALWCRPPAAA